MRAYWITAGVGVLVTLVGIYVYAASSEKYGILLIAGGLIVGVLGLTMRFIMGAFGDKFK